MWAKIELMAFIVTADAGGLTSFIKEMTNLQFVFRLSRLFLPKVLWGF